jgi:hypothetical protein
VDAGFSLGLSFDVQRTAGFATDAIFIIKIEITNKTISPDQNFFKRISIFD